MLLVFCLDFGSALAANTWFTAILIGLVLGVSGVGIWDLYGASIYAVSAVSGHQPVIPSVRYSENIGQRGIYGKRFS